MAASTGAVAGGAVAAADGAGLLGALDLAAAAAASCSGMEVRVGGVAWCVVLGEAWAGVGVGEWGGPIV